MNFLSSNLLPIVMRTGPNKAILIRQQYTFHRLLKTLFDLSIPSLSVSVKFSNSKRKFSNRVNTQKSSDLHISCQDKDIHTVLAKDMLVHPNFISESEEQSIFEEVERYMKRLRYQYDHWDNAIHGYRETEKKNWNPQNGEIIERVKKLAFTKDVNPLAYVHILDISKDGYIKPHVDAVRFCGDTITGLCLLSSCVMRLALESDATKYGDIYLPRRSLYLMRGRARYDFTHEVLKDEESFFNGEHISRDRRISIICRNEPRHEDTL